MYYLLIILMKPILRGAAVISRVWYDPVRSGMAGSAEAVAGSCQ
jgi:hypothetical protein